VFFVQSIELTAAAVQMQAELGDVAANLEKAGRLTDEAFRRGAELVILPEFFPSGVGFHPSLLRAALPFKGKALELLLGKAARFGAPVGGSFIAIKEGGERRNTFVLAFPDGSFYTHDKDMPTMWENCYYTGGADDGVMRTPLGPVGAALCWEMIRTQTVRRLKDKIGLLVGGSCWWTLPGRGIPLPLKKALAEQNLTVMQDTPARMARLLGVPVVHGAHAGSFECRLPWLPGLTYRSHFLGETQIVDGSGRILARLGCEQGDGVVTAAIRTGAIEPREEIGQGFWIPKLHPLFKFFWHYQNLHGRRYYRQATRLEIK
jgi:N-carbamoylputrescine amidase